MLSHEANEEDRLLESTYEVHKSFVATLLIQFQSVSGSDNGTQSTRNTMFLDSVHHLTL